MFLQKVSPVSYKYCFLIPYYIYIYILYILYISTVRYSFLKQDRPMKIAQMAPLWNAIPSRHYGGTEDVIYNAHVLDDMIHCMGHSDEISCEATRQHVDQHSSARVIAGKYIKSNKGRFSPCEATGAKLAFALVATPPRPVYTIISPFFEKRVSSIQTSPPLRRSQTISQCSADWLTPPVSG